MTSSGVQPTTDRQFAIAESLLSGRSELRLLAAMGPQQPTELLRAFALQARRTETRLTVMFADLDGVFGFLDDDSPGDILAGRLQLVPLAGGIARGYGARTEHVPNSLWDTDRLLRSGSLPVDVVVLRASAGPVSGSYSYGDMIGYTASALANGAVAVVELAEGADFARHSGSITLAASRADVLLPARPVTPRPSGKISLTPAQMVIGRQVAALIPDTATLQLGLGAVAEAVLQHLDGKRDLGVHSGIVTPSLGRLVASGVVNGLAKSEDAGLIVATGIFGTEGDWSSETRAATTFRPVSETHDPGVLARQDRLWAVNSALEVDLSGQVNAEFLQGARIASGGGQADFVRAAHLSHRGAAVIALPSVSSKGDSRIVACLPTNHIATSAAQDVDFVVTEHGVADLRGRGVSERARAMIAIAHPAARDGLRRQFFERRCG